LKRGGGGESQFGGADRLNAAVPVRGQESPNQHCQGENQEDQAKPDAYFFHYLELYRHQGKEQAKQEDENKDDEANEPAATQTKPDGEENTEGEETIGQGEGGPALGRFRRGKSQAHQQKEAGETHPKGEQQATWNGEVKNKNAASGFGHGGLTAGVAVCADEDEIAQVNVLWANAPGESLLLMGGEGEQGLVLFNEEGAADVNGNELVEGAIARVGKGEGDLGGLATRKQGGAVQAGKSLVGVVGKAVKVGFKVRPMEAGGENQAADDAQGKKEDGKGTLFHGGVIVPCRFSRVQFGI